MIAKMGSSVSTFKQQHPRYFLVSLCGCALIGLFMLAGGSSHGGLMGNGYMYPPSSAALADGYSKENGIEYPAFGPRDLTKAVARSEEIWQEHKQKRDNFVKDKGGYGNIRMFSDKAWVGYGQMYTLWYVHLQSPSPASRMLALLHDRG
jgi:hypothetical protein